MDKWEKLADGYQALAFLLGSGGMTTIIAAWLGWRTKRTDALPKPLAPVPIQIESPWMIQNLLGMVQDLRELRGDIDELSRSVAELTAMVSVLIDRRRREN